MAQIPKIIDLRRSFVVTDPNAFPENMMVTKNEDSPEEALPILGFEGYNFLPTPNGYKSYFGTNSLLDIQALPARCEEILTFQLDTYENILVALAEDGIYVAYPNAGGNLWTKQIALDAPAAGTRKEYSYCIIENVLYIYRQGDLLVHTVGYSPRAYSMSAPPTATIGAFSGIPPANIIPGTYDISIATWIEVDGVMRISTVLADVASGVVIDGLADSSFSMYQGIDPQTLAATGSEFAAIYFTNTTTGVIYAEQVNGILATDPLGAPSVITGLFPKTTSRIVAELPEVDQLYRWASKTPNFLNMAGQMGIFRANGRLGFWDSANSVSWSTLFDHFDFDNPEALAGYSTFNGVTGRIVNILAQGEGFVIYTTKGIVGVRYSTAVAEILWDATTVTDMAGIAYPFQATRGLTELEHFAFTNSGIKRIGGFSVINSSHTFEDVLADTYDFLKESREPVALKLINGRYLCFQLIDPAYINGKASFVYDTTDPMYVVVLFNDGTWDPLEIPPVYIEQQLTQDHIAGQRAAGAVEGMYLKWIATGKALVPSRTTPIKPYNQDQYSVHIPNTGFDTSSLLTAGEATALISTGTFPPVANIPEASPSGLALGWTYPGLNNTGSAFKGQVDSFLAEFIATQDAEFGNYGEVITNTFNILNQATNIPVTGATVNTEVFDTDYSGPNYDPVTRHATLLDGLVNADVAAHAGAVKVSGTTSYWDTVIGTLMASPTANSIGSFTGVGTNYAEYTRTTTLTGGYRIKRRTSRTYSLVATGKYSSIFFITRLNITPSEVPVIYVAGTIGYATVQQARDAGLPLFDIWDASCKLPYTFGEGLYTWTYDPNYTPNPFTTTFTDGLGNWYSKGYAGLYSGQFSWGWDLENTYAAQLEVKSVDTYTLFLEWDSALTESHNMTAYQSNISWSLISGVPSIPTTTAIPGLFLPGIDINPALADITLPGGVHLLQDASIGPIYPDFQGALVLDLALKKWGKMKAVHKALIDYSPLNSSTEPLPYTNFGMDMAMLDGTGQIILFDTKPADSWIRYGKIGYYRLGMTKMHELRAHFRLPATGKLTLESSLDGRGLETSLIHEESFFEALGVLLPADQIGRWHTAKISGNFDLIFLQFRGTIAGRR